MNDTTQPTLLQQRFAADRDYRYHLARAAWLLWADRTFTVAALLAGTSTVVSLASKAGLVLPAALATGVALVSLSQIVYSPARKAAYHTRKAQEYRTLHHWIANRDEDTPGVRKAVAARVLEVEGDEIDFHRVVDLVAHNEAAVVMTLPHELVHVTAWQRLTQHVLKHRGLNAPTVNEREQARIDRKTQPQPTTAPAGTP